MSCDAVAFSAFLWLASAGGAPTPAQPAVAPISVAAEPLYADIIRRAGSLQAQAEAARTAGQMNLPEAFKIEIGELAALDMKGHEDLKARGVDGDLKCILRGIAQDLPGKLEAVESARHLPAFERTMGELIYLLRDNVEVLTAPPIPPV